MIDHIKVMAQQLGVSTSVMRKFGGITLQLRLNLKGCQCNFHAGKTHSLMAK